MIMLTLPLVVMADVAIGTSETTAVVALGVVMEVKPLGPVSMVTRVVTADTPEGNETVAAFGRVVVTIAL